MTIKTGHVTSIRHHSNILDGRSGFRLSSKWGHLSILEGGGHICELTLNSAGAVNPLWKPTWKTIDPSTYSSRRHRATYGPLPEGPLLAGIAGHSISFDFFGPPSAEEIAAGQSTHGEAPVVKWQRQRGSRSSRASLICRAELPQAQMRLQRTLSLDNNHPVVYCEETATNNASFDRPISWNHHVTFGPPFLEPEITLFDMPATRSRVCPQTFSTSMALQPDADFLWPDAPDRNGDLRSLRTSAKGSYGHYTAHLLDPSLKTAYIAVCNPRLRLLVLYLFGRNDYPWVGNWEESYNREHVPWKGREFCRGFEFSTTPFPLPRREIVANGPLFGEPTYKWLAAQSTVTSRYLIALFEVPQDFAGVAAVETDNNSLLLNECSSSRTLRTSIRSFL